MRGELEKMLREIMEKEANIVICSGEKAITGKRVVTLRDYFCPLNKKEWCPIRDNNHRCITLEKGDTTCYIYGNYENLCPWAGNGGKDIDENVMNGILGECPLCPPEEDNKHLCSYAWNQQCWVISHKIKSEEQYYEIDLYEECDRGVEFESLSLRDLGFQNKCPWFHEFCFEKFRDYTRPCLWGKDIPCPNGYNYEEKFRSFLVLKYWRLLEELNPSFEDSKDNKKWVEEIKKIASFCYLDILVYDSFNRELLNEIFCNACDETEEKEECQIMVASFSYHCFRMEKEQGSYTQEIIQRFFNEIKEAMPVERLVSASQKEEGQDVQDFTHLLKALKIMEQAFEGSVKRKKAKSKGVEPLKIEVKTCFSGNYRTLNCMFQIIVNAIAGR